MLKITYTNGDVQNIKVTGDFFAVTLASKDGKMVKLSPMEKAESIAFDLAVNRNSEVSQFELFYRNNPEPKTKVFRLIDTPEPEEKAVPTKSFIRELKKLKKEWKYKKPTNRWVWNF